MELRISRIDFEAEGSYYRVHIATTFVDEETESETTSDSIDILSFELTLPAFSTDIEEIKNRAILKARKLLVEIATSEQFNRLDIFQWSLAFETEYHFDGYALPDDSSTKFYPDLGGLELSSDTAEVSLYGELKKADQDYPIRVIAYFQLEIESPDSEPKEMLDRIEDSDGNIIWP